MKALLLCLCMIGPVSAQTIDYAELKDMEQEELVTAFCKTYSDFLYEVRSGRMSGSRVDNLKKTLDASLRIYNKKWMTIVPYDGVVPMYKAKCD